MQILHFFIMFCYEPFQFTFLFSCENFVFYTIIRNIEMVWVTEAS